MALFHLETTPGLGSSFIYAPGRWNTSDGCVPVRIAWAYFHALTMPQARDALLLAKGIGLAFAGDPKGGVDPVAKAFDDAYPDGGA